MGCGFLWSCRSAEIAQLKVIRIPVQQERPFMKTTITALGLALALTAAPAVAAPEKYMLDASHSQILFSYNHLGYSTTWGMFSGFEGEIMFDQEDPANSSVTVSMPVMSMFTGWEGRFDHFMSADFFGATADEMVTFTSTGIEVTGDNTALITGDLTLNGVTKSVVLDAKLNQASDHPMENKPWAGFDATTTLLRSDYNVGAFAPFVSDEVTIQISIEAMKAE
jgi:polyisoprenoid-binding protein YceI